ncbi:hypothetical protein WDV06_14910 [Streptomyces racemochromogenes]|uniref:Uncharacterized protein n=1 Tax=Streptomyces racemochromogenes TaxID=67353 RepID=A0ABW7PDC9_9ACTN
MTTLPQSDAGARRLPFSRQAGDTAAARRAPRAAASEAARATGESR